MTDNMRTRYVSNTYMDEGAGSKEDWINGIEQLFAKVPEEFRESATLSVESEEYYGSIRMTWNLTYSSPATEDEIDGARKRQLYIEEQEKEQLRKLKEKYGDG